ncbi:MAG: hypothetical protein MUE46_10715 [Xanthomonadales bacterium]|nr:hypothetical protein [Xanthomonadales bacterium]
MNFGDHPGIHYFHVQNILLGGDPVERQSAERNHVYMLGAIPMPVPAEAEAQFLMIKEAIDLSKSVTHMDIPAGTNLDPAYNLSQGYRLNNIMELAPPHMRAVFLGRLWNYLNNLSSLSPHGIAFMRARGQVTAGFSLGGNFRGVEVTVGASSNAPHDLIVIVNDEYGGKVIVKYNIGHYNGFIEEVRGGDGQLIGLDSINNALEDRREYAISPGHAQGAGDAYAETLRRDYQLPFGFRPFHFGPGRNVICGTTELNGETRYTCVSRGPGIGG